MSEVSGKQVGGAADLIGDVTPKLASLTDDVLFADVWNRPGHSPRDRSLIAVASIITGGNIAQLSGHLARPRQRCQSRRAR